MSGSDSAMVATPAKITRKAVAASHAWRRRAASARVVASPPPSRSARVTSVSPGSRCAVAISGHDQRVAGLEEKGLQLSVGHDLVIVTRNPRHRRTLHAQNHHLRSTSKIVESSRERDGIEYGRSAPDVVAAGLAHLAEHGYLAAADLPNDDRHFGRRDVLGQSSGQIGLELRGGETGGLHVVEQRQ